MTDETLFSDALAISDPVARAAFLARVCPDPVQWQRVAELLAAHSVDGSFLTRPAGADYAGTADAPAGTGTFDPDGTRTPAAPVGEVGEVIGGKYKLIEAIGEGGMGTVWMAQQTEPVKRAVAVKLIKAGMDSKAVLARFEAERQALAMMDHPNIAKVLDAGATPDGRPYFVMELVKGIPITQFCDAHKLTPNARLELFVQVCNAIQHAHMKSVIHRDIKPGNVLVAMYDDRPVPKVIDFGVAKATGAQLTDRTLMTGFGAVVGTPEYMSPEQASFNQLDVDTRSDVYALGVLLYELLTGSTPVDRKSLGKAALLEILRIVREVEATRPSAKLGTSDALPTISANRGIEPKKLTGLMRNELDWIVMKALEKDRTRRYDTANGFAADVQRYLAGEQVQAVPPSLGYRLKKAYRRNRAAVRVASAFVAVLLAAVAVSSWLAVKATRAEAVAENNAEAFYGAILKADEALQQVELTAVGQRVDADLAEVGANLSPKLGLFRLARTLRSLPAAESHRHYKLLNGGKIAIPTSAEVLTARRHLREFVTAGILAAGQEFAPLLPPITHDGQAVTRLEISSDGELLLTLGADRTARLWDVRTASPIAILRRESEWVVNCGFSPDGRTVFTDDESQVVRFWNAPAGTYRARTEPPPNGQIVPKAEHTARELSISGDRLLTTVVFREDNALVLPQDRSGLGTAIRGKSPVELWDTATGRRVARLHAPNRSPDVRFLGRRWVYAIEGGSTVVVFSAADGREVARLTDPSGGAVSDVKCSPDGKRVVTKLPEGTFVAWDTNDWQVRIKECLHGWDVLRVLDDGAYLLWEYRDGSMCCVYHPGQTDPILPFRGFWSHLPRQGDLASLGDGQVVDTVTRQKLRPPAGRRYHPDLARFAPDGRFAVGDLGRLIDTKTEKYLPTVSGWSPNSVSPIGDVWRSVTGHIRGVGFVAAEMNYGAGLRHLPPPDRLDIPPLLLELWLQVALRGEIGPDETFVKWDQPTWERKRQELAAQPAPYPDLPFPGCVATDKLHWLRAEYADEANWAKRPDLARELLRLAEANGDRDEVVRWRMELEKSVTELAPLPREVKK